MKSHVVHIGIVDHSNTTHSISFGPGVNVVTGKSSTGKSALIEIFDYCFGSSDFTVPEGVITENAEVYFIVISIKEILLVLARRKDSSKAFLKEELDVSAGMNSAFFKKDYFAQDFFFPITDFKKELNKFFGLQITDVDESIEARKYKGKASPTPSVRSLASFILQHQNLVANKHAIFYRFDEKEKREQAIEHFKIFINLVDQEYFIKTQDLNTLRNELRAAELRLPREEEYRKRASTDIAFALDEFEAISGHKIDIGTPASILQNPGKALAFIRGLKMEMKADSTAHADQRARLVNSKSQIQGELRKLQHKLSSIQESVNYSRTYFDTVNQVPVLASADIYASKCPFCETHHLNLDDESNKLHSAIEWLNIELRRSPFLMESFEKQEKETSDEIKKKQIALSEFDAKIKIIDSQVESLENFRSQYELSIAAKVKLEIIIEQFNTARNMRSSDQIVSLNTQIAKLKSFLEDRYKVREGLEAAEKEINQYMEEIGQSFDFEESYKPIRLRFSLETFDLWHDKDGRKVFLRSMGSGANWLYCHVTLFLALQKYFCKLGEKCCIPSILFLDQPSQVYFPSVVDNAEAFDAKKIAQQTSRIEKVDEDIKSVVRLFSELVRFSKKTLAETGIEPQIIVTDHADNLTLEDGEDFEKLVNGRRWRKHGFVNLASDREQAPVTTT